MTTRRKTVKFRAIKVEEQPTIVVFTKKNGEIVKFKATKGVAKKVNVEFKARRKRK